MVLGTDPYANDNLSMSLSYINGTPKGSRDHDSILNDSINTPIRKDTSANREIYPHGLGSGFNPEDISSGIYSHGRNSNIVKSNMALIGEPD